MKKLILLLNLVCVGICADVTNVAVLQNPRSHKKVVLIGAKHLFAAKLSKSEIPKYTRSAEKQAAIILDAFNKSVNSSKTLMIEAQFPYYDESIKAHTIGTFCQLYEKGEIDTLDYQKLLGAMHEQFATNDNTNMLEVLAEKAQGQKGVILPDKRGILTSIVHEFKILAEIALRARVSDYQMCLQGAQEYGAGVKQVFGQVDRLLDNWIGVAEHVMGLLKDSNNRDDVKKTIEYLKTHQKTWTDFQDFLNFPPTKSIDAEFLKFVKKAIHEKNEMRILILQGMLKHIAIDVWYDNYVLNYIFLNNILAPDAPSLVFVVTGFLHTTNLLDVLNQEGYVTLVNTKMRCRDEFTHKTETLEMDKDDIIACGAKNIVDFDERTVKQILDKEIKEEKEREEV